MDASLESRARTKLRSGGGQGSEGGSGEGGEARKQHVSPSQTKCSTEARVTKYQDAQGAVKGNIWSGV